METQTQQEQQQGTVINNDAVSTLSALQIRLDTNPILEGFELFLRGQKLVIENNGKGGVRVKKLTVGDKKANNLGIQSIMSEFSMIINSQTVQGNLKGQEYDRYIREVHIDFATNLVNNSCNWDIDDDDLDLLIDAFMHNLQLFVSRTIDNEERTSYGKTLRTLESNTLQQNRSGFLNWGNKGVNSQ